MRDKGFTLIEVILIIVVAAIAIPVLLVMMGQEARLGVYPEVQVTASNLAQSLMEETKSKAWSAIANYTDTKTVNNITFTRTAAVCYVNITDFNTCVGGPTEYKRITVTVSSTQGRVELITLRSDYE